MVDATSVDVGATRRRGGELDARVGRQRFVGDDPGDGQLDEHRSEQGVAAGEVWPERRQHATRRGSPLCREDVSGERDRDIGGQAVAPAHRQRMAGRASGCPFVDETRRDVPRVGLDGRREKLAREATLPAAPGPARGYLEPDVRPRAPCKDAVGVLSQASLVERETYQTLGWHHHAEVEQRTRELARLRHEPSSCERDRDRADLRLARRREPRDLFQRAHRERDIAMRHPPAGERLPRHHLVSVEQRQREEATPLDARGRARWRGWGDGQQLDCAPRRWRRGHDASTLRVAGSTRSPSGLVGRVQS